MLFEQITVYLHVFHFYYMLWILNPLRIKGGITMDMQAIGRKISSLRKERDMTQVDLADKLGVTYQAISSWERGNSMPDIAKLPDISQVLNVSIDDLLNNKKASELIKNVLSENDQSPTTPDFETLADIAPILKPSQVTELMTRAESVSGDAKVNINNETLELMIEYMESESIKKIILQCENIDTEIISKIACSLESSDLKEIVLHCKKINEDILAEVVDYMESSDLKEIVLHNDNITAEMIAEVVDYMESSDLKEVLLHCNNITAEMIAEVVDYLESSDLKEVLLHCNNISDEIIIETVDYLESYDIKEILLKCKNLKNETLTEAASYMESNDLKEVLQQLKNVDKKTLKEVASYMDEDDLIDLIIKD